MTHHGSGPSPEDGSVRRLRKESLLARRLVSLADSLVDDFDVVDLMDQLVSSCVELLDTTAAGLLLIDQRGGLQVVASSSEESRLLELFQLQSDEGPCLEAITTGTAVWITDSGSEGRWPRFMAAAAAVGFRSALAVPLRLREQIIGGLNLFRDNVEPLSEDDRTTAQALADIATIAVLQQRSRHRSAQLAEQLQTALDSRIVIEQAKGVLAEFGRLDMDQAYRTLRDHARRHNLKLGALADDVVHRRVPLETLVARSR